MSPQLIRLVGLLLAAGVLIWPSRTAPPPWAGLVRRRSARIAGLPRGGVGRTWGWRRRWRRRWRRTAESVGPDPAEVAAALDLAALAVLGGSGLVEALEQVARHSPPRVAGDLRAVCAACRWGWSWDRAWRVVGPTWERGRRAFVLAELAGASPARPLRAAADDVRRDHAQRLEEGAARVGVRIVLPLGLAYLPAFVLLAVVPLVLALAVDVWG